LLSIFARQNQKVLTQSIIPKSYNSKICRLFVQSLPHSSNSQILDVGPVCCENIIFFGQRVKRLFVCDMFFRLHKSHRKKLPKEKIWRVLDYPKQSFDGILLWDIVDRLDKEEAMGLVRCCHLLLKPGGTVMLAAYNKQTFISGVNTFVTDKDFHVSFRAQKHLELYMNFRHNREIMTMFSPLSLIKAQLNKNGFREFLFQRLRD